MNVCVAGLTARAGVEGEVVRLFYRRASRTSSPGTNGLGYRLGRPAWNTDSGYRFVPPSDVWRDQW